MINEKKICKEFNSDEVLELIFIYLTEVSSSRDYDDVIITLADMGRILTNADRCSVWVVDEAKKTIWTKVAHGIDEIEMPMFQGIVGHAIKSGSRVLVDDAYKDERFNQAIDEKTGYLTESMMVVPMHDKDEKIIGAFQVINNRGVRGTFNQDEMNRLMLTSTFAAETLISAKLTHEIEETQKEVVLTMGAIAESRSKETGNHVKRVAEYSKILALAYGLSEEEAELLRQASPMHDIGKIAIADSILNKPGKFTHHEYETMKQHAQLGYEMIKGSKRTLLKAASIVAHEHHEKFDGSGYPRGLSGDNIHIYGRITAVADVFDALGSNRVYKKAWSDERIFTLFKEESGKHFDPALIKLFFNNLDEILAVRESLRDDCDLEADNELPHIKVLGAYGSRSKEHGSSSFLLDQANAIDAGNLINSIGAECAELQNIWLTHSHLDHIIDIAFILDNYFEQRTKSLHIYGLKETIMALKKHFLNDLIWPDFSKIPLINSSEMSLIYHELEYEQEYKLNNTSTLIPFKTEHTVPSCGFIYKKNTKGIMITSDTISLSKAAEILNSDTNIATLIVECSFPTSQTKVANASKHLTPTSMLDELKKIKRDDLKYFINHIKPSHMEEITREIETLSPTQTMTILKDMDTVAF